MAACAALSLLAGVSDSGAQPLRWIENLELRTATDSLALDAGVFRVQLSHPFVTEELSLRLNQELLTPGTDVTVDRLRGMVILPRPARAGDVLVARYRFHAGAAVPRLQLHELRPPRVAATPVDSTAAGPPDPRSQEQAAARPGALRVQGSKTVSVQGGTNRDATVDQALQLSVSGMLTETIGVRAEISDENLPITPEGNTEELSDLDQVRIEMFGPGGRALLGDFVIDRPLGAFLPYQRKLQGLHLRGRTDGGRASVLAGSPKGRRSQLEFRGREATQGPYELLDGLRLDQSFIVAGSERVWLDGELMIRGESRDYVVDYIRGTVTFTENRSIGPENLIAVDFETSATGYSRTVASAGLDSVALGPALLRLSVLRESDNADRPSDGALSDEDEQALQQAGDDVAAAVSGGIVFIENGEGRYVERFTQDQVRFFEVADTTGVRGGDWNLTFLRREVGEGDYVPDRVATDGRQLFRYVGPGLGDHVIGRQLALPTRTDAMAAAITVGDPKEAFLAAEGNATRFDANRLSTRDDEDNDDLAWRLSGRSPWMLGDGSQRGLRASLLAESIGGDYRELGRIRQPFFYEAWNLQEDVRDRRESHQRVQVEGRYDQRTSSATFERLTRQGRYEGTRLGWSGGGRLVGPLRWQHRLAETTADREETLRGRRRDRSAELTLAEGPLRPSVRWTDQRFSDPVGTGQRGYRFEEYAAGVLAKMEGRLEAQLAFRRRLADSLAFDGSAWKFATDVREWTGNTSGAVGDVRLELQGVWRRAELPGDGGETTRLARFRASRRPLDSSLGFDLDYRAGTDRSRVLQREIVFVGLGQGDFDIEGNPVGQRQGDYNVVFLPSDSLVTATEAELNAKVDFQTSRSFLGGIRSESLLQIEERSRSDDVGAVLRFAPSVVRKTESSLFGSERLRQELVLLRSLRRTELRLTFDRTERLDRRFSGDPEETTRRDRTVRLQSDLGRGFSSRVEAGDVVRSRRAGVSANPLLQNYDVLDRTVGVELRYRPMPRRRTALELRYTRRREQDAQLSQNVFEAIPSATADVLRGRFTVELRLAQVEEDVPGSFTRPFFFERPGTQRRASVLAQWGAGGTITVSVRAQLRDEPQRPLQQELSVETRARF